MARIAENLLLLLLDNASARPALDQARRQRILSGAVLLDLAHTCRIRPSEPDDSVAPGHLVVLPAQGPDDPALVPAIELLSSKSMTSVEAVAKLRRSVEPQLLDHLVRSGHLQRIRLYSRGFRRKEVWTLLERGRPAAVRAALMSTLFDDERPEPTTAAIISLLHIVDGLSVLLSLDERSRRWADERAGEIASGSWVQESIGQVAEVNLAVTTAAIRPALV